VSTTSTKLVFRVDFLRDQFSGVADRRVPEWPPSPARLFQAMVGSQGLTLSAYAPALQWLELRSLPDIYAPRVSPPSGRHTAYGPQSDGKIKTCGAGAEVIEPGYITEGLVAYSPECQHVPPDSPVYYVYDRSPRWPEVRQQLQDLAAAVCWLGHSEDIVQVRVVDSVPDEYADRDDVIRWVPGLGQTELMLSCPLSGLLSELCTNYTKRQEVMSQESRAYVPSPSLAYAYDATYRDAAEPMRSPHTMFEIQTGEARPRPAFHAFAATQTMEVAAMSRHALLESLRNNGFQNNEQLFEQFAAGHLLPGNRGWRSLLYVPIPSRGSRYADGWIRRVLLVAPPGPRGDFDLAVRLLSGATLQPQHEQPKAWTPCQLWPAQTAGRGVYCNYCDSSDVWETVVPMVLPRFPSSAASVEDIVLEDILRYYPQPRQVDVRPVPPPERQVLPKHLRHRWQVHVRVTWDRLIAGPIVLGAGRAYGFGLCERR